MKASENKLMDFLKKSPQFIIPIYQRSYNWTERECRQLWDDIIRTGKNDTVSAHFIGSIVYVETGLFSVSSWSPLLVIDGQQRLTTITLLIEALARALGDSEPLDGFSSRKLREYYMLNPLEKGERRYKLLLSQTDKNSLLALLDQQSQPKECSIRITENFALFEKLIDELEDSLQILCKGLAKLIIVDISLNRNQDNPQLIFESLNSTGRELSQADLIRNYIMMGLDHDTQTKLYEHYWRPMEIDFGQEAYTTHFDSFIRHYLIIKTGEIPKVNEVYEAFKRYTRVQKTIGVEHLVKDVHSFAEYFCRIVLNKEKDQDLKAAFLDIRELKVDVAIPFMLEIYDDYSTGKLSKEDLLVIVRLVESYVFRRAVCGLPTNSMNKIFAYFTRALKKDQYLESVQAHFLLLPSYRRFPNNEEFKRDLKTKDLYNFRSRSYWLRRLENYGRKEQIYLEEYTIEHIMPQNENLSSQWKKDLGQDWDYIHKNYLHTIGNLTLTGYNSEYGDHTFQKKRDIHGGFAQSPLKLNLGLGSLNKWDESSILKRAENLATIALEVWKEPRLEPSVLENYKPKTVIDGYTIEDHPNLEPGPIRDLFDALRKAVLDLDPCVTEEFLAVYVAYKAETNFVDVVPQTKKLRLLLNLAFHEIYDPKHLCKDVSGIGKWGNGDVEVCLSSHDDLPYVLSLIKQSFNKQMGNGVEL